VLERPATCKRRTLKRPGVGYPRQAPSRRSIPASAP
jgi:hypothetical protein